MRGPLSWVLLISEDRTAVVFECRHCGTVQEKESGSCPSCHRDEVARYEFPSR